MTGTPQPGAVTLEDTIDNWVVLPRGRDATERWAGVAATQVCAACDLPDAAQPSVRSYLADVAAIDRPSGYAWRLLFTLDPKLGSTIWDIAFLTPDAAVTEAQLVGADQDFHLGGAVTRFEWNGMPGIQSVRYEIVGEPRPGEGTIGAIALVVLTRPLPSGPTTLVARAETCHLDALASSLAPLQYLLCSDEFAELVAATQTPTGEEPGRPLNPGSLERGTD